MEEARTNKKLVCRMVQALHICQKEGFLIEDGAEWLLGNGYRTEWLEVQLSCTVGQVAECPKALKAGGEKRLKSIVSSTQQIRGCKGRLCPPGERNVFPNLRGSLHVLTSHGAVRLQASQGSCLSLMPTKVAQLEVKPGSLLSHSVLTVLPRWGHTFLNV